MKKISVISAVLMIVAIIVTAFSLNTSQISASSNSIDPNTSIVKVHAQYCKDCSKLSYCLDGVGPVVVGKCDFEIKCNDDGPHSICVFCQGYDGGGGSPASFTCGMQTDIYVDCRIASANCIYCGPGKK
jgi:hypothetical protein